MKKIALVLLVFVIAGSLKSLHAQNQLVYNLCYDEEFTETISVVSGLETSTLTLLEKLKFKDKKYVKNHHEYINNSGMATRDIQFVSHENMYPEWYTPPSTIRSDNNGTKSYFATDNKYLSDGWPGGLIKFTEHGEYIEDESTGERYLAQPHSTKAKDAYEAWNNRVNTDGFLKKYTFSYPSEIELQSLQNDGFEVTKTNNILKVENASYILAWDVIEKIFIRQNIKRNAPIKTVKTYYQYNENFDTYLIDNVVTNTPKTFENGDCYETVINKTYSNYSSDCSKLKRIGDKNKIREDEVEIINQLEIYPNPVIDQLIIKLPNSDLSSIIEVRNVLGDLIIQRKVADQTSTNLKVSILPSGIYIIKVSQGKESYSSKFIKQ